jgi:hypothetical protein
MCWCATELAEPGRILGKESDVPMFEDLPVSLSLQLLTQLYETIIKGLDIFLARVDSVFIALAILQISIDGDRWLPSYQDMMLIAFLAVLIALNNFPSETYGNRKEGSA